MGKIKEKLDAFGIPMVILYSPSKKNFLSRCIKSRVPDILTETCGELGIDFINTLPLFHLNDFWMYDRHWNHKGHRKNAEAFIEYLIQKKYID